MPLPEGYILRHPEAGEAKVIQALLDAAETADVGEPRRHAIDVLTDWGSPRCRPAEDWWVAESRGGEIAAVGWVWPETVTDLTADHYVHPDHRGRGLGETMLDVLERRAAELVRADTRLRRLTAWAEDADAERRASLERRRFVAVRQYFEMAIDLGPHVPSPAWPEGITARGFRPGRDDRALYEADQEAFVEHHLYEERSYDEWRLSFTDARDADVTLWWLAWDGDDLAGFAVSYTRRPRRSDRRPRRAQGVAGARHRPRPAAGRVRDAAAARPSVARLYVDAQNVTNAVRVYEAVGMHVSRRFDVMEKPLV